MATTGAETQVSTNAVEKHVDNEGDAMMGSARSASEVQRVKSSINVASSLRKSSSGATFSRLKVMTAETSGELPSPRLQQDIDASYCSYDVTNTKNLGNQSPVSLPILLYPFCSLSK